MFNNGRWVFYIGISWGDLDEDEKEEFTLQAYEVKGYNNRTYYMFYGTSLAISNFDNDSEFYNVWDEAFNEQKQMY